MSTLLSPTILDHADCKTFDQSRTVWGIIWSCLVTVFARAWVSIHPNVPRPRREVNDLNLDRQPASRDLWLHINVGWIRAHFADICRRLPDICASLFEKLFLALSTLLAPEYIFLWALRQRLSAGELAEECRRVAMTPCAKEGRKMRRNIAVEAVQREQEYLAITRSDHAVNHHWNHQMSNGIGVHPKNTGSICEHGDYGKRIVDAIDASVVAANHDDRDEPVREDTFGAQDTDHDETRWTLTQGFFIVMGGYHQYNGNTPGAFLQPKDVVKLVSEGLLIPPHEEEIVDRSKTDSFSKIIVCVQTFWFVTQCIARHAQHLPITELEIATLAYTTVIIGNYICWWSKPLSVAQPVRVPAHLWSGPQQERFGDGVCRYTQKFLSVVLGGEGEISDFSRAPRFYSGETRVGALITASTVTCILTAFFGAIHCLAWSFHFPSRAERVIWQSASLAIVVIPIFWLGLHVTAIVWLMLDPFFGNYLHKDSRCLDWTYRGVRALLVFLALVSVPAYLSGRAALVVVAFTSLRALPVGAFETVTWTTYVPHI